MQVYQNSHYSMGTRFNLLLPGIVIPKGDVLFSSCVKELNRIENMLSCFLPSNNISFINKHASQHPVEINDELFEILKECLNYFKLTQGCFDISLGRIIDLLDEKQKKVDVDDLIKNTGADKIVLDPQERTVHFKTPYIKINLGGYGKGYALHKILDLLKEKDITSGFISFGESSISCIGKHPHGDYWPVGIQNFHKKESSIATFKMVDMSISTSGNIENSNHIIHPRSGKPIKEKMMISVKSHSPIEAEVLSTALMVANEAESEIILNSFMEIEVLKV